jgi:hypothetical protein
LLKEFLAPFARSVPKEGPTPRKLAPYIEIFDVSSFNEDILYNDKACLVFFTTTRLPIEKHLPIFNVLLHGPLKGAIQFAVFYVKRDDEALFERFNLQKGKVTQARFYRNLIYGEHRETRSLGIDLGGGSGKQEEVQNIMQTLHENLGHEVREINERYVNTHAINNAIEHRKHTLIYFFDDEQVNLHFKALSALPYLQEDFLFISVNKPSGPLMREFFINSLPAVRGSLAPFDADEDVDPDKVKQFQYAGKVEFDDIMFNLMKLTGKEKEWQKKADALRANRRAGLKDREMPKDARKREEPKKKKKKSKTRNEEL